LTVTDLLPAASGHLWIADARARALKVYSQQGWRLQVLGHDATGLRCPVSLASLHGRWIAALDGHLPAVVVLDDAGRPVRRFRLPELDRPVQICALGERRLAVVGSGWGAGAGKLVHLYTPAGEYIESLFGEPRNVRASERAYLAAVGDALYLGHTSTDSFAIYDIEASAVFSFPSVTARIARRVGRIVGFPGHLRGLFATSCGPLLALFACGTTARDYQYDLYSLDGEPMALGIPSSERVIGVEGPLFYSVCSLPGGDQTLRVWKLSFNGNGS
jgi:hypothetical protein